MSIRNTIIKHYKNFFDLHAKGIALTEDDHLDIDWAESLVKDCFIPDVSSRLSFARFVAKDYDIRIDGDDVRYAEIATGDNYSESEIYKKWQLLNGC